MSAGTWAEALALLPSTAAATDVDPFDYIEETLRRWHDETHAGAWQTCREQPCHALQAALDDARWMGGGAE